MGINFDYIQHTPVGSVEPPCPCGGAECKCVGTATEYRAGCWCTEHRDAEVRPDKETVCDRARELAIEMQADFNDENPQHEYCGSCPACTALDAALASPLELPLDDGSSAVEGGYFDLKYQLEGESRERKGMSFGHDAHDAMQNFLSDYSPSFGRISAIRVARFQI